MDADSENRERHGLAAKRISRKRRHVWLRRKIQIAGAFALLLAAAVVGNWAYQVWRKPSELIGVFDDHFHKGPEETWRSYAEAFRQKSTPILTPEFLAALAQAESNGNPIVRTYWKFRWTMDLGRIFAPASSAVGMFQITEGTFKEAQRFCLEDGSVHFDGDGERCARRQFYSRLIPAHAIEMTAARLHYHTERLTKIYRLKRVTLREKQNLATIIHLCGLGKAERLARAGLRLTKIGRCGDHDPVAYVRKIQRLQSRFQKLNAADRFTSRDEPGAAGS